MNLPPGLNKERIAEKKLGQIPTGKKTGIANWIPVTKSKPINLQRVLVVQEFLPDEQEVNLVRYMADVDGWMGSIGIIHYNVTHWQPLPNLPKIKGTS